MTAWAAVLLAGFGTFLLRFGVAAVVDRVTLPGWFERASVNVMPACFAGLVSLAFLGQASAGLVATTPLVAGAVVTIALARARPPHVAMLCGLRVVWIAEVGLEAVSDRV